MLQPSPVTPETITAMKRRAAAAAVALVEPGMTVGLGGGSTAAIAIELLAARGLPIACVACSRDGAALAARLGLRLVELSRPVDLTIDGADEVDPRCDLIKGGGGALLHEKILAQASRRLVIAVDASKRSPRLGTRFRLPIEVFPYGWERERDVLAEAGLAPVLRGDPPFVTDEGNHILDGTIGEREPRELAAWLDTRAAIAGHGLFLGMASELIVGEPDGVTRIAAAPP
jgi:ribose 5-phosphate isomerase A